MNFKLIDDRFSGLMLSHLREGECGYVDYSLYKNNNQLWFSDNCNVSCKKSDSALFVGRTGDLFYVMTHVSNGREVSLAEIAWRKAYPLDNKFDNYYLVPVLIKDRIHHPLVKQSIEALKQELIGRLVQHYTNTSIDLAKQAIELYEGKEWYKNINCIDPYLTSKIKDYFERNK